MTVLEKVRAELNAEIKAEAAHIDAQPDSDFLRGRLRGLFWVRDHLLYNVKELR